MVPQGPAQQRTFTPKRIQRIGSNLRTTHPGLSEAGLAFLKCAFASPDFSVDPGKGIPDQYAGRSLAIKDCSTVPLTFLSNSDTYILIAPIPGYAYFTKTVAVGANPLTTGTPFQGVTFPTFPTNFGDGNVLNLNYSKFRYASLAAGLYPTSNLMQFSGSVQSWRLDLNLAGSMNPIATIDDVLGVGIAGLSGVTTLAPRDNYSESFIKGMYTYGFDHSQDFMWSDFVSAPRYALAPESPGVLPASLIQAAGRRLTGLGNTNTILIKVTTPLDAVNTAVLRVWNCIELQVNTNSALYQFSGVSPTHDALALEIYHALKMRFPVAIPCSDNAKFWQTVLKVVQQMTAAGKYVPGNIGLVSGAVNNLANILATMAI